LDKDVEFSQYDTDGDGYIDNVFIFYAGTGENRTGETDAVWPHTSWVTQLEYLPYTFDGVTLDRYACTNEWVDKHPDGIGTFCHEFSHVMGLPDLYHTSYGSLPYTPGEWSVMDYGPYLNEGRTPPLYSSFERYALGWMTPEELTDNKSFALLPLSSNQAYCVSRDGKDELFFFENRQPEGWDRYLPGHGMVVWHVDYNDAIWDKRAVNNDEDYQRVDLIEADNIKSSLSRGGDSFPGTAGITEFNPSTVPAFAFHDRTNPGLSISAIKERPGGEVTFRVGAGDDIPGNVAKVEVEKVSATSIAINWTAVEGIEDYIVEMECKATGEKSGFEVKGNTRFEQTELKPETPYTFLVTAFDGKESSAVPASIEVTTTSPEIDYYTMEIEGIGEIKEDGFTINWNPMSLASAYLVNIEEVKRSEPYKTSVDFTDGIDGLPAGWTTTSRLTYASKAYSGVSPLSLRLSANEDYVTSGDLEAPVYNLSFWMRGSSTGADDRVAVEILKDGEWVELTSYPIVTVSGGENLSVDLSSEDCQGVRIMFKNQSENGSVAIDDIMLEWGGDRVLESLTDWSWREIEAEKSYKVSGLS
ncbi:MAG: M6 family metalloprotease domain-containing protein, partial [Muribaculaceae bacterium]|nr:M6 family metalloprotease domain-containing protein [Muribaculaceae bacterium]